MRHRTPVQHCGQVTAALRFAVGDAVSARVELGWASGRVAGTWDQGHPYRIALQHPQMHYELPETC